MILSNRSTTSDALANLARREAAGLNLAFAGLSSERPLPVMLVPSSVTAREWLDACRAARLLGQVLTKLAGRPDLLDEILRPLQAGSSLPGRLATLLKLLEPHARHARSGALIRHDLMLDARGRWRWIESNVIAAGMGPFGEHAGRLQRALRPHTRWTGRLVPNPASERQARYLVEVAAGITHRRPGTPPLIVFAVEQVEDNRFDQDLLQAAVESCGGRVVRRTLAQLDAQRCHRGKAVCLPGEGRVDGIYFRTGYNTDDYGDRLLDWRWWIEQFDIALFPNIALQLAGSKWVQQVLSRNPDAWLAKLGFGRSAIARLVDLFVPQVALREIPREHACRLVERGWLLKTQREGGGSVLSGEAALEAIERAIASGRLESEGLVLMEMVEPRVAVGPVAVLRDGDIAQVPGRIAELGLFTIGSGARRAGYLVRSKPPGVTESGIHAGHGMLDALTVRSDI